MPCNQVCHYVKFSEISRDPTLAQELLVRVISVTAILLASVVVGYWIGEENRRPLMLCVAAVVTAVVAAGMRDRAWVLIPLGWALTGASSFLPFALSIHDVCILLAAIAFVGYRVMTQTSMRQTVHPLSVILAVNLAWLVVGFIRHPVGLLIFGSERIGGRPDFYAALAAVAFLGVFRF